DLPKLLLEPLALETAAYLPSQQRAEQASECYFYCNETKPYNLSADPFVSYCPPPTTFE
ncbi:hypothetical protein P7K49_001095, partial [Saguinus oedipus]